ncbi:MAG: tetratricopeptide repeat protein [Gallionella sp.]|nr:tetratricopeptide repeat protein [Gallionella sp.]
MSALDLQEQEQIDALKAWWKENANKLIGLVLVVALAAAGWRGWQYYQNTQAVEAATLYAGFIQQVDSGDSKRINDAAAEVMERYPRTAYAPRAALLAAQVNEQAGDTGRASTQLQWALAHTGEPGLKSVAGLRLAAILLDEKKYDEALKQLDAEHPAGFDALYADLRGDVLNASGKRDEARSAYALAYDKTPESSQYRNLIQMKLDALGVKK